MNPADVKPSIYIEFIYLDGVFRGSFEVCVCVWGGGGRWVEVKLPPV